MANYIIGLDIHYFEKGHESKYKWCTSLKYKDGVVCDATMTNVFKNSYIMNETEALQFVKMSEYQNDLKQTWDLMTLIIKHVESDQTLTVKEFKGLYDV